MVDQGRHSSCSTTKTAPTGVSLDAIQNEQSLMIKLQKRLSYEEGYRAGLRRANLAVVNVLWNKLPRSVAAEKQSGKQGNPVCTRNKSSGAVDHLTVAATSTSQHHVTSKLSPRTKCDVGFVWREFLPSAENPRFTPRKDQLSTPLPWCAAEPTKIFQDVSDATDGDSSTTRPSSSSSLSSHLTVKCKPSAPKSLSRLNGDDSCSARRSVSFQSPLTRVHLITPVKKGTSISFSDVSPQAGDRTSSLPLRVATDGDPPPSWLQSRQPVSMVPPYHDQLDDCHDRNYSRSRVSSHTTSSALPSHHVTVHRTKRCRSPQTNRNSERSVLCKLDTNSFFGQV